MSLPKYTNTGPVDSSVEPVLSNLVGKSVIVTGGASGLGKAYVEGFVAAGAYVTIGDLDETGGKALAENYPGNTQFVRCNVTSWQDQLALFEAAVSNSPHKSCDIAVANAGTSALDPLFRLDDDVSKPPTEPTTTALDVNITGVIYTAKLAMHYFRRQPLSDSRDRCLILKSSVAGFFDFPGVPQYQVTKFAVRGLMRSLRHMTVTEGIRVNVVAPWFIKTPLVSEKSWSFMTQRGIKFADISDSCAAVLRLACDKSIHGRSLGVFPRDDEAPNGYLDLCVDDFGEGDVLKKWAGQVLVAMGAD